jgi:flagellar basal body P-ring formation protein FlgA
MPQSAPSRAPQTGAGRRSRGVRSVSFGPSADLSGGDAAASRPGGLDRFSRFGCLNLVARLAAPVLALCGGLACAGALAQTPGNPIYIAGPGAQNGADAPQMSTMLNAPGRAAPLASAPEPARDDAAQSGMITIPGPGERTAAASQASAPNIVTIPAPAAPATTTVARNSAPALPRVNVGTAATRVAPVVVGASAAAVPNNGIDNAAINAANARANVIQRYAATTLAQRGAAASAGASVNAPAVEVPPGQEDGEAIHAAALTFLQQQSAGLPGRVTVTVSPVFPRGLAACTQLEPFMPPGARTWGRTTVGVRCVGAKPWTLYVAARVAVDITYYTAARQIEPGQMLSVSDLVPREGDLATLPRTVITDPSQANGALALLRITAGLPLRTDMLRSASSVVIGQTVKVVAEGANFTISAVGSALNTAAPGQQVRVRTEGGQIITGVVKDAGTVQVQI